jgi:hypothetical protein
MSNDGSNNAKMTCYLHFDFLVVLKHHFKALNSFFAIVSLDKDFENVSI